MKAWKKLSQKPIDLCDRIFMYSTEKRYCRVRKSTVKFMFADCAIVFSGINWNKKQNYWNTGN